MKQYPWFYVWSPKYEVFHRLLFSMLHTAPEFDVHPVFMPQSIFERKEGVDGNHFLTGIGIKIHVLLEELKKRPGEFIIFSDCDLVVFPDGLSEMLEKHEINDITCMSENADYTEHNIGFMLVKSTPQTIEFMETVLKRILKENLLDQTVFKEEIVHFQGTHGFFPLDRFLQSNMLSEKVLETPLLVLQCLCSEIDPIRILVEKLLTIDFFVDIKDFEQFIPQPVLDILHFEQGS